ncbi:GerMN domain-containing protein [Bacillus sp. FJAT-42315]|uniref:GerMN domain-containing protein n=1 Tax=Bacillus sp. FJAT-42315 TaxID=2014077 RepID=UPI000C248121|nr:GerMN domain-containing protein [Bacillus sp. FJAT-42315]
MLNKKTTAVVAILIASVYATGCGLLSGEKKEKIDPPQSVTYTDNLKGEEQPLTKQDKNMVMTELYLIDKNGYVVSQTMPLSNTKSLAKQALEHLVAEGPISNMLPNDFRPVLPAGTQVQSVDVQKGVATVDFSPEFKEYAKEDEARIVQAVTWTLTQFDSISRVKMRINGHELKEMPVANMPLHAKGMTRKSGINFDTSNVVDVANTRPVTVYFMAQQGDNYYYVPVTRRIANSEEDQITAVIKELTKGPKVGSGLVTEFIPQAELLERPIVKDGRVTLNFNEAILGSMENKMVSDHILKLLALSLTEDGTIESLAIQVAGSSEIITEKGEPLSSSVTRPEFINPIGL